MFDIFINNSPTGRVMLPQVELRQRLEYYFSNVVLIWIALIFYRTNKYYVSFLRHDTQQLLFWLAAAYTVIGFILYVFMPAKHVRESKGATLLKILRRLARDTKDYIGNFTLRTSQPPPRIDPGEKTVLLFMLVKIFFLPLMINFLFGNFHDVQNNFRMWQNHGYALTMPAFNGIIYPLALALLLLIDTAYFAFGYSIESSWLGNKVRSVEPTFFGWMVALVCYPPFTDVIGNYANWYANDYSQFSTEGLTFIMRLAVLALFGIYVSATVALGAKCSNLTNRGIVSRGPYAIVRHPAYIAKNLAWWVTVIPVLHITNPAHAAGIVMSMVAWTLIYFLRAITEERHLIADPEYQEYAKKVKYRFIPHVF